MKKTLGILLIAICLFMMQTTAFATETVKVADANFDESLTSVLNGKIASTDTEILFNPKYYDQSMANVNVVGKPIVKCYNEIYWNLSGGELQAIISVADKSNSVDFIVFDDSNYRITKWQKNSDSVIISMNRIYFDSPNYLKDIQSLTAQTKINNTQCNISNIICFDGSTSFMGILVYLITDQGTFVKYYENNSSNAMLFPEQEFKKRATKYYNFLISQENNYNENGEPVGGTNVNFSAFLQTHYNDTSDEYVANNSKVPIHTGKNNVDSIQKLPNNTKGHSFVWYIIIPTVVALVVSIATIVLVWRKKKSI